MVLDFEYLSALMYFLFMEFIIWKQFIIINLLLSLSFLNWEEDRISMIEYISLYIFTIHKYIVLKRYNFVHLLPNIYSVFNFKSSAGVRRRSFVVNATVLDFLVVSWAHSTTRVRVFTENFNIRSTIWLFDFCCINVVHNRVMYHSTNSWWIS